MNAASKQTAAQAVHKTIYAALAAAQSAMGPALKETNNPHFRSKYADLGNVMDACLPALNANGIAVVQPPFDDETGRYVKTIFLHGETGQTLECRVPLIVQKNDMQGYGSAVTYARRYGLMAMAGIAPEDDDGNAASKAAPRTEDRPAPKPPARISADQFVALRDKASEAGVAPESIANAYSAPSLEELPLSAFDKAMARLNATIAKNAPQKLADDEIPC